MNDVPSENSDQAQRLSRALVALQKMRARIEELERRAVEPIAVIGMGCRFPGGADDPESYWRLLRDGVDAVTPVPPDRWDIDAYYDPDPAARGRMASRFGAFLRRVDELDARFFNISPREAAAMDPQQRLLLEVSWEALEDAGQPPEALAGGACGVFIGINTGDYLIRQLSAGDDAALDFYVATGNAHSVATGRISFVLGLHGPNMAVDTACSSSLTAVHLACQSLRTRECRMALAGGVNVLLAPEVSVTISNGRAFAADGRCKTFDAAADGYVRGEGCGVIVLKRLSDALGDGDPILALIRGSAVNHGGQSGGLTVPHGPAQEALVRSALQSSGVAPGQLGYVEAHGTGTALGDPIEVRALAAALGQDRPANSPLFLGSVKTNMGHLEAAAGIAGLIKVILSLQHKEIPPHLHFKQLNPLCEVKELKLTIPTALTPWPRSDHGPRVGGVSSFGISGTNAHVLVEEAPADVRGSAAPTAPGSPPGTCLLPLSARSPEALKGLADAYRRWLAGAPPEALKDICFTASARRGHHDHRLAVTGRSPAEMAEALGAFIDGIARPHIASGHKGKGRRKEVVFVFSGQGSQWAAMGRDLLQEEPVFRAWLERCDRAVREHHGPSVLEELLAEEGQSRLGSIDVIQPVLFSVQVGLAELWRSWGVEPDAVIGHSMGEIAAACVAGALTLDDAARVICTRSRMLKRLGKQGTMAVVELPSAEVEALIAGREDHLSIAACNSPTSTVISGGEAAVAEVMAELDSRDVFCRRISSDVAGHCAQVDVLLPELRQALEPIAPRDASTRIYSTVIGGPVAGSRLDAPYWARNMRAPVLFAQTLRKLIEADYATFIEVSPHPILPTAVEQGLRQAGRKGAVLPSAQRGESAARLMRGSLGALYALGHPVQWRRLYPDGGRVVRLPSYPWARERHYTGPSQRGGAWAAGAGRSPAPGAQAARPMDQNATLDGASPPGEARRSGVEQAKVATLLEEFWAAPPDQREAVVLSHLGAQAARVLALSTTRLDVSEPVVLLGMNSLMVFDLRNWVKMATGISIPMETFSPQASVIELTRDLAARLLSAGQPAAASPSPQPAQPAGAPARTAKPAEAAPALLEDPWVIRPRPSPDARLRLFCFPFAGSGASMYRKWPQGLPPDVEVCAIQPPGREHRLGEAPIRQLHTLVRSLVDTLSSYQDRPFAFFGHSFGGLVSYEVARELRRRGARGPAQLFVSASRAPQLPDVRFPSHRLPDPLFVEEVRKIGGMPDEILLNEELLGLFLPSLRADFAMLETYVHLRQEPLDCPISAFAGGLDTTVSSAQVVEWRAQTRGDFTMQVFPGGHFFLQSHWSALLEAVSSRLLEIMSAPGAVAER